MKKNNLLIPLIPILILILIVVISFVYGSRYSAGYSGPYKVKVIEYEGQNTQTITRICFPVVEDQSKYSSGQMLNNISNFSSMMANLQGLNWINLASLILSRHSNYQSINLQSRSKFPVIILSSKITDLNTEKVEMAKELCSHGFITVMNRICIDAGKIKPVADQNRQKIGDIIKQLKIINQSDAEHNGIMDLSMIGILKNKIEEITPITNIDDCRIKAIVSCDIESGLLYFPESKESFIHHRQRTKPFYFTRVYINVTKYIWTGVTENMERYKFKERPIAKSIVNVVNSVRNRFQQRKIKSLQSQIVSCFKTNLLAEIEFSMPGKWSGSNE